MSNTHVSQLILYACSVGPLAQQIEAYLEVKRLAAFELGLCNTVELGPHEPLKQSIIGYRC